MGKWKQSQSTRALEGRGISDYSDPVRLESGDKLDQEWKLDQTSRGGV